MRGQPGRHVDSGLVPGAVAVLARHGEVHVEATGTLAFEGAGSAKPMAADTTPLTIRIDLDPRG